MNLTGSSTRAEAEQRAREIWNPAKRQTEERYKNTGLIVMQSGEWFFGWAKQFGSTWLLDPCICHGNLGGQIDKATTEHT